MGRFEAIAMGVSAGGLEALDLILPELTVSADVAILVVQHLSPDVESHMPSILNTRCDFEVKEAEDKEPIRPGVAYVAPPNYHLMVERDRCVALSTEPKVKHCRPSVDVLFDTAAEVYCHRLVGVILTGANEDGADGLGKIKRLGGFTVVQAPDTALADAMPRAALSAVSVDAVVPLAEMGTFLNQLR